MCMNVHWERMITTVTAVLPHTGTSLWRETQRKHKFSFQEKWRKMAGKASRAPCWINPLTAGSRNKLWQNTASTFLSDWRQANAGEQYCFCHEMCWKQCSATPLSFYILGNRCPVVVIAFGSCANATVDLNWWMTEFSSLREENTFGKTITLRKLCWKKHDFSFFLNHSSVPKVTNEEVFCFGTYCCAANYTRQNFLCWQ